MPLHWRPVGPEAASTYWLRRAVVLVAVLAVGALALRGITGGSDTLEPAASPSSRPSVTASQSPSPSVEPSPVVGVCPDDVLEVQTTSEARSYGPGAEPALTLTVRNTGAEPCRRAVGQGAVEVLVTSGPDRIWSSDDCAPGGPDGEVVLAPGQEETALAVWPGIRSRPGCTGQEEVAEPGTYRLVGRVGELRADGATFVLDP